MTAFRPLLTLAILLVISVQHKIWYEKQGINKISMYLNVSNDHWEGMIEIKRINPFLIKNLSRSYTST